MEGSVEVYPFPTFSTRIRLAVALLTIGLVFVVDRHGGPLIDNGSHFILMGTAVMASAWLAGTGAALAATVIVAALGATRIGSEPNGPAHIHLALFLMHALLVVGVIAELRRARLAAEVRAKEAQTAKRQGESANRMKDEFLATISHELRTPLNAVLGWVHLLRTGKLDEETAARGLESIDRNVRIQSQLTSDLLDVSKALTGQLHLDPRPSALDEAAREAAAALRPAAEAKDVRIDLAVPVESVIVHGDPARLRQIALQLLANAIKFSPRGGVVEMVVDGVRQDARLIVRDHGPGIDPTFLPRIFDRFTQADPSPTRTAGGLGVGLALVRELVELQGGEIVARNREDGTGAVFSLHFPLRRGKLVLPAAVEAPSDPGTNGSRPFLEGLRVLVLDQEAEGRDLLRTVLQQRGAMVETASSVADALQHLEAWRPDVLVSDSLSPDHDSYALIGKVHSLDADRGGRIPAVALTSVSRTDARLRGLLADVHRDVPKPVEPGLLTSEIARVSGRERRRAPR